MTTKVNKIYTKEEIKTQLEQMNAPKNKVVLMHSSLRSIGKTENGAKTVLDAMIEYFTSEGGLFCVPTHTWDRLNEEITLDYNLAKTCLGAFSDFALADGRGVRSLNPTHSMVVFGEKEKAEAFIKDELYVTSGTAPSSCYGKIFREGGYILLVGVSHNRNTYLHAVEEIIGVPDRLSKTPKEIHIKLNTGEVITRNIHFHQTSFTSDVSLRFPKYELPFRYHGAITDGFIGSAPTQLCDARKMKKVMEIIFKNSNDSDPLADEKALPPKLYC